MSFERLRLTRPSCDFADYNSKDSTYRPNKVFDRPLFGRRILTDSRDYILISRLSKLESYEMNLNAGRTERPKSLQAANFPGTK